MRDLARLIAQGEGQYLEFKSAWHGVPGAKKSRASNEVRDEIAEYVAAFANADGGTLLIGVEDDRTVTGHAFPPDKVQVMLAVPEQRLKPPQLRGEIVMHEGKELLVFEVEATEQAVMVIGDGFPRRVGDEVFLESEASINAIKSQTESEGIEGHPATGASFDQLDPELVQRAQEASGLLGSPVDYLVAHRLADRRGDVLLIRQGALLLFAREPHFIQNPNAGVRIFHVQGTATQTGARHNVVELGRLEGALPRVLAKAYEVIGGRIRKSVKLHDLFFRETPEYPTFAWQEAVVNAVAHRDYRVQGRGVEVWMYDDRIEVSSPGGLLAGLDVHLLQQRQQAHQSRNPRITRVLAELGFMREQGEGIPRMFEEMERSMLQLPDLRVDAMGFKVVLRNEPIFKTPEPEWVAQVAKLPIGDRQRRALVAFRRGTFTSAEYQQINQVDRDEAYRELTELVRLRLLTPPAKRGRGARYMVLESADELVAPGPEQVLAMRVVGEGGIRNADYREVFGVGRDQAKAALADLVARRVLIRTGERRGTRYSAGPELRAWAGTGAIQP